MHKSPKKNRWEKYECQRWIKIAIQALADAASRATEIQMTRNTKGRCDPSSIVKPAINPKAATPEVATAVQKRGMMAGGICILRN